MSENINKFPELEDSISSITNEKVEIKKVVNRTSIICLVAGALMFVVQTLDKNDGAWTMFLLIMGICTLAYGAISLGVKKTGYFYDGKRMMVKRFLFDADRYAEVLRLYDEGKFSGMLDIPRNSAAKMMLKVLVSKDYAVAFSQLYKFSPLSYNFEPSCPVREHDAAQCENINTLVISY